jgi:hypothetical protein
VSRCAPVVIGRIQTITCGIDKENQQPSGLAFLGRDWVFVHDALTNQANSLVPPGDQCLPRNDNGMRNILGFLRERALAYVPHAPRRSLKDAFCEAFGELLETDPHGGFNLVFTNGDLSFVLIYNRPFYHLQNNRNYPETFSTIPLTDQRWTEINRGSDDRSLMLILSKHALLERVPIRRW